jgi:hypothetical protein
MGEGLRRCRHGTNASDEKDADRKNKGEGLHSGKGRAASEPNMDRRSVECDHGCSGDCYAKEASTEKADWVIISHAFV